MIKFTAVLQQGSLYGFGLTEANLNRLQFNNEPIFFNFDYINRPDIYGLILYLENFENAKDINENENAKEQIIRICIKVIEENLELSSINELRIFPITHDGMEKFRELPYWGYETFVEITHPKDRQLFFAGRTEEEIEKHLTNAGYISSKTKSIKRGFKN